MRMRQKEAEFYFVSYPAEELLRKVRFVSRFHGGRGEAAGGVRRHDPDDVEQFITASEGTAHAFRRERNRRKVRQSRERAYGFVRDVLRAARDASRAGFYERFPARGKVERDGKVRRRLGREAGMPE